MGFNDYKGSVKLGAGLTPQGGTGAYPLMQTCDIQAEQGTKDNPGKRLDVLLDEIKRIAGVGSGRPIPIESATKMDEVLNTATTDNIGMIYKYEGESTDIYESGTLYIITDELPDGDGVSY